jgi:tetratricopeptide (TPR) repeat protein
VGPPTDDWPKLPGSVHPEALLDELCALRLHPAHTTPQQILPFIPMLPEIDPREDESLQTFRMLLAQCATLHAATTHLMQTQEWDFLGVYYDAIDRFGHAFMQYHPPKRSDVDEVAFQRYQHVMSGCYRFHDMMLGRLVELAGEDATVIILSDHGFYSDELRPEGSSRIKDGQPVAWHRPYGVLAINGPHVKQDERVYGASLLDIAPTILTMFGLPVGEDMDGRALVQIFDRDVEVRTIGTYEDPEATTPAAAPEDDPWVAQQMLEQLRALGYVGEDDTEGVVIDRLRNLGHVYLSTGRAQLALEQFEQVRERKADDAAARMGIASAYLQMGRLDECEAMAREAIESQGDLGTPRADLFLGMIAFRRGDDDAALEHLHRAEAADAQLAGLQLQIGQVYLRRQRWDDAQRAFESAIERDADSAEAYDGLGVIYRHLDKPGRAVHMHMESIGRLHHRPQSHINLGLALAQLGRVRWAIRAFETSLEMAPDHPVAHQALAQLYALGNQTPEKAAHHRQRAAESIERARGRRSRPDDPTTAADTDPDR